jgi:hypothetical protein
LHGENELLNDNSGHLHAPKDTLHDASECLNDNSEQSDDKNAEKNFNEVSLLIISVFDTIDIQNKKSKQLRFIINLCGRLNLKMFIQKYYTILFY